MKRILIAVVLVLGAVWAFKQWDKQHNVGVASGRVAAMLHAMADKDEQTSLCRWALNKDVLDRETMSFYYDRYLKFVAVSGLDGLGWNIADARRTDDGRATVVTVRNGDRTVVLKVTEGLPIELQE